MDLLRSNVVRRMKLHDTSRLLAVTALFMVMATAGCDRHASPASSANATESGAASLPDVSADDLLQRMVAAYRQATAYQDAGQGRLRFELPAGKVDEQFAMSVTFERPNKLRMHCYDGLYFSDGTQVRGSVGQLDKQVLGANAPAELTLDAVYQNQVLARALGADGAAIAGTAPQLTLLLSDDFLESILKDAEKPQLVEPTTIGDTKCHGVSIRRPDGQLTLWIEPETYALRRIDYPIDALKQQLAPDGKIAGLSLSVDFVGAKLNGQPPATAFEFAVPEGAKLVENFDLRPLVPPPTAPSPLLGKAMPAYSFVALDGTPVTSESLAGKVVVFDFWATWCGPCLEGLPRLQQVYDKYKDDDRVRFFAVSSDDSSIAAEQLTKTLAERQVTIPILRDPQLVARDVFGVQAIPNTFVLGSSGTVEVNEIGAGPRFAEELSGYIEKLLAGESVVEQVRAHYAEKLAAYEKQMNEPLDSQQAGAPVETASLAPVSEPATLKREPLWTSDAARFPGNMLAVHGDGDSRVYLLDGGKTVVELASGGQAAATHKLALPEGSDVTYLRTTVDPTGKRYFAGTAPAQQQCHVFDDSFQTLLSFPSEGQHAGISDIQLADLDGNGQVELLVGYWDDVGVQCVALEGKRNWSNRSVQDVFSIAVSGPDAGGQRAILCANRRGSIVPIDALGNAGQQILLDGRYFRLISAADMDGDGQAEYCAIGILLDGNEVAIGLNSLGQEVWTYPLPKGAHPQPIEMIQAGNLVGDQKQWIFAAPDGSVHIVAADGKPVDKFNYGAELAGIVVAKLDGKPALLISSRSEGQGKLEAFRLQ